ncbi:MAG: N-acetylmuramoyl-L-alanine amidase [Cyanobacteria bacterium SIG32]|nr:N-acetylmuramoyl-L-alanine amidase [Cyanobacteria bacterium SIG32]
MKKIVIHWTAGGYYPSDYDKKYYHYLIDKDGVVHDGVFKPENNLKCVKNNYAMHTGGGNTGAIGVAMCGMFGFKNRQLVGNYSITPKQFEATMNFCAELSKKYKIEITPNNVMTHYEFGQKHPQTTSAGKIDIVYLPPYPWVAQNDIGAFIRAKIKWYKLKGE